MHSEIERRILSREFDYLQPYFYNNPYALRCELGVGETDEEYMRVAYTRAEDIYAILFPRGADAMIFHYWLYDWAESGPAERTLEGFSRGDIRRCLRREQRRLRFLLEAMRDYRHVAVKDLGTGDEPGDADFGRRRRSRIVCYADETGLPDLELLHAQIRSDDNMEVSLVSFENECILSVYDDRGCDVVFASPEKLRQFYAALEPYFLDYDRAEMARRYDGT